MRTPFRRFGRSSGGSMRRGSSLTVLVLVGLALWVSSGDLAAQSRLRPLPPDHWTYDLFETLDAVGIQGVRTLWHQPLLSGAILESLREGEASSGSTEAHALLSLWSRALEQELGMNGVWKPSVDVGLGWEQGEGRLMPARGGFVGVLGGVERGDRIGLWAEVETSEVARDPVLVTGGVALNLGNFSFLVGRIPVGLGQGLDRILLTGGHSLDGALVGTRRPVRLPGGLSRLGVFSLQAFLSQSVDATAVPSTWYSAASLVYSPHPRVQLTAARSTRFAGEGLGPATLGTVLRSFYGGEQNSGVDDAQVAVGARVRWSVLGQPFATYLTVAFEDPSGIVDDPAIQAGAVLPLFLGGELVALRYEYDAFGKRAKWCVSCEFSRHDWYDSEGRNYGPFAVEGVPVGSALGGYGSAHRVELGYWSSKHPLSMRMGLFRERREAGNLLLDRWPGLRRGAKLDLTLRLGSGVEIRSQGMLTWTEGGKESGLSFGLRVFDVISRTGTAFSSSRNKRL